jgi:2-aminoadipate transaminase
MLPTPEFDTSQRTELPMTPSASGLSRRAQWAGGQPISFLMHKALAHPELISLAAGFVDQRTLPVAATAEAVAEVLGDEEAGRVALQYGTTAGYEPLRELLLQRFLAADGVTAAETGLTVNRLLVTAGSNQLLHLVADTLLDPGDLVLCDAPSYFVFLGILQNLGARAVGVTVDELGVIPEALEEELERREAAGELERVKAIYVVSYFDNPRGVTLPVQRRRRIVEIARRWSKKQRIHVIDDTAYRQLRYCGEDVPSLRAFDEAGDTVIVAQTFSKSFSPGIRVGYGILPAHLVDPVLNQKGNLDFGSPNLSQHIIYNVLRSGRFDRHVARLRDSYREKLTAMLEAAERYMSPLDGVRWARPTGGLYVWLAVPESLDTGPDGPLFDQALAEGMIYVPGAYCYPAEGAPAAKNLIRLSFGVQTPENIRRGMQGLARAIQQVQ